MHDVKVRRVCYEPDYTALLDVGYDVVILHILETFVRKNELAFQHQLEYSNAVLFSTRFDTAGVRCCLHRTL